MSKAPGIDDGDEERVVARGLAPTPRHGGIEGYVNAAGAPYAREGIAAAVFDDACSGLWQDEIDAGEVELGADVALGDCRHE